MNQLENENKILFILQNCLTNFVLQVNNAVGLGKFWARQFKGKFEKIRNIVFWLANRRRFYWISACNAHWRGTDILKRGAW